MEIIRAISPARNQELVDYLSMPFFGYEHGDEYHILEDTIAYFLGEGYDLDAAANTLWGENSIIEALDLVEPYQISTLVEPPIDLLLNPININYKTGLKKDVNLFADRVFYKGELQQVIYYQAYDDQTKVFSIPVIKVTITYSRGANGIITDQGRTTLREYYSTTGNIGRHNSTHVKYYDGAEKIKEIKRRRQNLIDNLELIMLGLILQTDQTGMTEADVIASGRAFMVQYEAELQHFVNTGVDDIVTAIQADTTYSWLDNITTAPDTIRDFMAAEFDLST